MAALMHFVINSMFVGLFAGFRIGLFVGGWYYMYVGFKKNVTV